MNETVGPYAGGEHRWPTYAGSAALLSYFSLILLYPLCHHLVAATVPTPPSWVHVGLLIAVLVVIPTAAVAYAPWSAGELGGAELWTEIRLYFLTHFMWLFASVPAVVGGRRVRP